MIFRTITDDVTGANKSIGLFGLTIKDVSNKLQEIQNVGFKDAIFNSSIINIQAVNAYNSQIEKGATAQQALAIASKGTNKATIALMESAKGATISTEQLTAAQKASTLASKAQSLALKTVALAGNMIAFAAIAKGISYVVEELDNYIHRNEIAIEKADELKSSLDDAISSLGEKRNSLENLSARFTELSKGVDNYGNVISLTSDESREYNDLVKELVDLNPSLVQGYNDAGQAIINKNTALKDTIELLEKERQLELEKATSTDNLKTIGEGAAAKYSELKGNDNVYQSQDYDLDTVSGQASRFGTEAAKIFDEESIKAFYAYVNNRPQEKMYGKSSWMKSFGLTPDKTDLDLEGYLSRNIDVFAKNMDEILNKANIDMDSEAVKNLKIYVSEWETLNEELKNVDTTYIDEYIQKIPQLTENYKNLTDQGKNFVSEYIRNSFSSFDLEKNAVGVKTSIVSLVDQISEDSTLKNAINNLFTMDTSDMSVDDIKTQVDSYINTIATTLQEDPIELKARLGFDDSDTEPLVNKVKGFLKDEFDNRVGELTLDELDIASNLEIPYGTLLTWDELIAKIKEAKEEVTTSDTTISFKAAFNADDFKDVKEKLLELAKAGELTPYTLSSTKEYNDLLQKTGLTAEQAYKKIMKIAHADMTDKDWQTTLTNARSQIANIQKALDELKTNGESSTFVDTIISEYPQLLGYLGDEQGMREQLIALQGEQEEAANRAFTNMIADSEVYYNTLKTKEAEKLNIINNTVNAIISKNKYLVDVLGQNYQIDLNNYKSIADAKAKLETDLIQASAKAWSKFYSVQVDASTGMAKVLGTGTTVPSEYMGADGDYGKAVSKMVKEQNKQKKAAQDTANAYNKVIASFNNVASNTSVSVGSGCSGSSGGKSGSGGRTKKTTETYRKFSQAIDWCAETITNLSNKISNLNAKLNNTSALQRQIKYYKELISAQKGLVKGYEQTANKYQKVYNNALKKLSKVDRKKVVSGVYTIEQFNGKAKSNAKSKEEKRYNNIQAAIKARDDVFSTDTDLENAKAELNEYIKTLVNIRWEKATEAVEKLSKSIELLQAKGNNLNGYVAKNENLNEQLAKQREGLEKQRKAVINTEADKAKIDKSAKTTKLKIKSKYKTKAHTNSDGTIKTGTDITDKAQLELVTGYNKKIKEANKATATKKKIDKKYKTKARTNKDGTLKTTGVKDKEQLNYIKQYNKQIKAKNEAASIKGKIDTKYKAKGRTNKDGTLKTGGVTDKKQLALIKQYNDQVKKSSIYKEELANMNDELAKSEEEYKTAETDKVIQQADNIIADYENRILKYNAEENRLNSEIALAEARGQVASADYYKQLTQNSLNRQSKLKEEKILLEHQQKGVVMYSDAWYELQSKVNDVDQAIADETVNAVENINKQYEALRKLTKVKNSYYNSVKDSLSFLEGLTRESDLYDDKGQFTDKAYALIKSKLSTWEVD